MPWLICLVLILFPLPITEAREGALSSELNDMFRSEELSPFYSALPEEESVEIWYGKYSDGLSLVNGEEQRLWQKRMEEDLIAWTRQHLESSLSGSGLASLEKAIADQSLELLYRSDQNELLFDSAGDPLLRDPELYPSDRELWSRELESRKEMLLERWEEGAEALIPGILLDLPMDIPASLRTSLEGELKVSLGEYGAALRREAERLIIWSSASFDYLRQRDEYSLRHKSEDESAGALADRLARETGLALAEAEDSLKEGLDMLKTAAADRAEFSAEDWEASFRSEFQKGLDLWAEAEKELMASRLSWELRCETKYLEGEELWDRALKQFSSERQEWIGEISVLLDEGKEAWEEKEENCLEQINRIVSETELAAAAEEGKFLNQVNSALELYRESSALLRATEENVLFYEYKTETMGKALGEIQAKLQTLRDDKNEKESRADELNDSIDTLENTINSGSSDGHWSSIISIAVMKLELEKIEESLVVIRNELERYKGKEAPLKALLPAYREELSVWRELQGSLEAQLAGAEDMLFSLEAEAAGYDSSVPLADLDREIRRREEETEALYRQWEISEAVTAYARLETASRPTEAQTARDFEESEAALGTAEKEYLAVISSLRLLRESLIDSQGALADKQKSLEQARELMKQARDSYEESFAVYQSRNPEVLEQLLDDLDKEILSWYGEEDGGRRDELYSLYFRAGESERLSRLEEENIEEEDLPIADPIDESDLLLARDNGEDLLKEIGSFSDVHALLDWYLPLLERDQVPDYMIELYAAGIRLYWRDELEVLSLEAPSMEELTMEGELSDQELESALFRAGVLDELVTAAPGGYDPFSDGDFLRDMMNEAVTVLLSSGGDEITPDLSAFEYLSLIKNGYLYTLSLKERRAEVEEDLEISRRDAEEYRRSVVDADFQVYKEKKILYDQELVHYKSALEEFGEEQQRFLGAQAELEQAADHYKSAKLARQQAREILDFASTGYTPSESGVSAIREARRKLYDDSLKALTVLQSIKAGDDSAAVIDERWASWRDESRNLLSLSNNLEHTSSDLDRMLSELNRVYGVSLGDMYDRANSFVDLTSKGLSITFDESMLEQNMTNFSSWGDKSLKTRCDQYFSSDDAGEVFSKDLMLWMSEMGGRGDALTLLKTFSYAYYHELVNLQGMTPDKIDKRYSIDLFHNAQHKDLLDQKGDMFDSVHIGYKGDLDRYLAGKYKDVREVLTNGQTGEVIKVYIGPEEWTRDKTASSWRQVVQSSSLNRLYSFYKLLMFSSCIRNDLLARAMEQDLSAMAWEYIDDRAYHEQRQFKRSLIGGYRKPGRDIRDKRKAISKTADYYSGHYDRRDSAAELADFCSGFSSLQNCVGQKADLAGGRELSLQDLTDLMADLSGINLGEAQLSLLEKVFSESSSDDRKSASTLLESLMGKTESMMNDVDGKLLLREAELSAQRASLGLELSRSLEEGDLEAYAAAAEELFASPSYLQEEYRNDLHESIAGADSPSENESFMTMKAYGSLLLRSFHNRLEQVKTERYAALQSELNRIRINSIFWEKRVDSLITEGLAQWDGSAQSLIGWRESWRSGFEREYREKSLLWEAKHGLLVRKREEWLTDSSNSALETGTEAMARQMDLDAGSLLTEVSFSFIPDMETGSASIMSMLKEALDGKTMDRLLSAMDGMSRNIRGHDLILSGSMPVIPTDTVSLHSLYEQQDRLKEDISKALLSAQALQMKEAAMETEQRMMETIDEANESVDLSVESRLRDEGYDRRGGRFVRTVIIDSSLLGGNETERQDIESYRYFRAPELDLGVDLSLSHLKTLSSDMIRASVNLASERLNHYMALIFGTEDDSSLREALDRDFISYLEEQEKAFAASGKNNDNKDDDAKGLFSFHLGYAPEMRKNKPEKVKEEGYGEFGRIFKAFAVQQARLLRGLAGMNAPWYNQKIWDDDADNDGDSDGIMGAPSVRSVVNIAVSAVSSAFMGPFPALMISMIDDAVFTLADLGNGVLDADEAGLSLAKTAGTSLISYGAGEGFAALDELPFFDGAGEVFSDIGYKGLEISAVNYGSAALGSFETDGFSWNSFGDQTSWENMSTSYFSGLTGQAVSSTLELGSFGFTGSTYADAAAFTDLAGGLSGSAVEYALEGRTKLNLLRAGQTGLLEWNIGGDGALFDLGMDGTDISGGTLMAAGRGLYDYSRNLEISRALEDRDLRAGMRTLYSGVEGFELHNLYDQIISGETIVKTGTNQDYEGYTDVDGLGRRVIDLNKTGKSSLDLAVLMSHEAYRDGLNNGAAGQLDESFRAVAGHMETASDLRELYGSGSLSERNNYEADLLNRVLNGELPGHLLSEYTLQNYDMSGDFWKLTDEGKIVWDGQKNLVNEEGEIIRIDKTGSYSLSLMNWFGRENSLALLRQRGYDTDSMADNDIAYALMKSSGAVWDESAYSDTTGRNSGAYVPRTVTGGQSANSSTLEDRLSFQLSENEAFHRAKISQESPDIAVWVQDDKGKWINGMAASGCYYMSTLGAVQTQAGKLLTTEQINRITERALKEGWLDTDEKGVFPTGDDSKTFISHLAFQELGEFGYLKFNSNSWDSDGSLIVGETIYDNYHAREGNKMMDFEIFDPYENISYKPGQYINFEESIQYEYYDYQKYYWKQFEKYYF